jgi:hypothetical protein
MVMVPRRVSARQLRSREAAGFWFGSKNVRLTRLAYAILAALHNCALVNAHLCSPSLETFNGNESGPRGDCSPN